ncbi:MAG: ABC transporter permease, partial [Bacteroidota bacterium]
VAFFLMLTLRSLVTTLNAGVESASASRLIIQSAVSLFVDLPQAYQPKVATVDGVAGISKWQWFGGYYREESNRFAQFAMDPAEALDMYPEMQLTDAERGAFLANRRGALVGEGLANRFGFAIGDTVPILPEIFPHPDGPGVAWEFEVCGIYRPTKESFDPNMFLFHWDYFEETVKAQRGGEIPGTGTYVVELEPSADATAVMAGIDGLFENGPQRVQTTSEAEFQRQFVTMFGNVPFFVSTIGGGVLLAILLAVVNTMLMSGREQTREIGILKALGFSDGDTVKVLVGQSVFICAVGADSGACSPE